MTNKKIVIFSRSNDSTTYNIIKWLTYHRVKVFRLDGENLYLKENSLSITINNHKNTLEYYNKEINLLEYDVAYYRKSKQTNLDNSFKITELTDKKINLYLNTFYKKIIF